MLHTVLDIVIHLLPTLVMLSILRDSAKLSKRTEALEAAVSESPRALKGSCTPEEASLLLKSEGWTTPEEKLAAEFAEAALQHGVVFDIGEVDINDRGHQFVGLRIMGVVVACAVTHLGREVLAANIEGRCKLGPIEARSPVLYSQGVLTKEFFERLA